MVSFVGQCFSSITDCFYGTGEWTPNPKSGFPVRPQPEVVLDSASMGSEAVLVKNATRLCGTGGVRATAPIQQNKAYWEVKVQQSGIWSCGVGLRTCDMNKCLGEDERSWVINSENVIQQNRNVEYRLDQMKVQEGDVIGFSYDHVELNFYLNGVNLNCPLLGIKGTVYPVLYVDDGAILDAIFESFRHEVPHGYDRIMVEQALL
eukprot:maker-scaffold1057_size73593-snap-gene-0.22 protein:Tk01334 transcript:maker-scaffold1057_size73593-snap-gene-0.22-mRNA-1 annotation:"chronic lymphocytic leukemia deletion region gene 6 protein"